MGQIVPSRKAFLQMQRDRDPEPRKALLWKRLSRIGFALSRFGKWGGTGEPQDANAMAITERKSSSAETAQGEESRGPSGTIVGLKLFPSMGGKTNHTRLDGLATGLDQ